ncbi:MAG: hypothetical protein ABI347_09840 [Nitrososphaera sp.]|jgi:prophage maintenance system killer protein
MSNDDLDAFEEQEKLRRSRPSVITRGEDSEGVEKSSTERPPTYDEIVAINKAIMDQRKIGFNFEVDDYILEPIVKNLEKYGSIADPTERVLKQASYMLASITFRQPFFDGNKTTALFLTQDFLRRNGLKIPVETKQERDDLFELLNDVMHARKDYDYVEKFVKSRVVNL